MVRTYVQKYRLNNRQRQYQSVEAKNVNQIMKGAGAFSVVLGVVVALVSGLFLTPQPHIGIDVVMRGFPVPWRLQVIPMPEQHILWDGLVEDIGFWVVIVLVISSVATYLASVRSRTKPSSA
jgi:hypothetical protein